MSNDNNPVRWGILGAARIADGAILPGIAQSPNSKAVAIAARDLPRAQAMADKHGIDQAYGSYEALLADTDVEVVYIALPNHLHVEWAKKALQAGKHVLCEKPAAMTRAELEHLCEWSSSRLFSEAFMVRHQPRWQHLRRLLADNTYGEPLAMSSLLSFHMTNTDDFRHKPEWGGGAYYDLGCYTAMAARFVFGAEPERVQALMHKNAAGIDLNCSVIMDFGSGRHAIFNVALVGASSQTLDIVCERAYLRLPNAYVPSTTLPAQLIVDTSTDHANANPVATEFEPLFQYEREVSNFSNAVRGEDTVFYGLNDALANAAVADAVFASAQSGTWINVQAI